MNWLLSLVIVVTSGLHLIVACKRHKKERLYPKLLLPWMIYWFFILLVYYIGYIFGVAVVLSIYISTVSLGSIALLTYLPLSEIGFSTLFCRKLLVVLLCFFNIFLGLFISHLVEIALKVDRLDGYRLEGWIVGFCLGLLVGVVLQYGYNQVGRPSNSGML